MTERADWPARPAGDPQAGWQQPGPTASAGLGAPRNPYDNAAPSGLTGNPMLARLTNAVDNARVALTGVSGQRVPFPAVVREAVNKLVAPAQAAAPMSPEQALQAGADIRDVASQFGMSEADVRLRGAYGLVDLGWNVPAAARAYGVGDEHIAKLKDHALRGPARHAVAVMALDPQLVANNFGISELIDPLRLFAAIGAVQRGSPHRQLEVIKEVAKQYKVDDGDLSFEVAIEAWRAGENIGWIAQRLKFGPITHAKLAFRAASEEVRNGGNVDAVAWSFSIPANRRADLEQEALKGKAGEVLWQLGANLADYLDAANHFGITPTTAHDIVVRAALANGFSEDQVAQRYPPGVQRL